MWSQLLSRVTHASPRHTITWVERSSGAPDLGCHPLDTMCVCVSSPRYSQWLGTGREGVLRGPREATYVKLFVLGDDFCVGNDGRRLTSEELVG